MARTEAVSIIGALALVMATAGATPASEAVVAQVPAKAKAKGCALCIGDPAGIAAAEGIDYYVSPGPADVIDTVQFGSDNVAVGLSFGEGNYIGQFQFGYGNVSTVGIVADDTSVAVVQDGNRLQSNLLIWGNPNAAIGVYQPPGSPPVNAAIFTAADGTQVIFPGNATTVIRR